MLGGDLYYFEEGTGENGIPLDTICVRVPLP